MRERIIFHVDVNNAFLSWEAVFRLRYLHETLDLRTIPSAVGGDRDQRKGIILAKSTPAKKYGIRTAEPIVDALRKCPELVIVPGRFDFYSECSHAFMDILREYTDLVEPFSVDEAFVDLSDVAECRTDPLAFADMLRDRIRTELGFTVNIGVSENKLLAKMASDFTKPDRSHSLFPEEIPSKMWPLPVGDLLFVGASTTRHLADLGIHTIGELAHFDRDILSSHFGKSSEGLIASANGLDDSPVTLERADAKGYSCARTTEYNLTDPEDAHRLLLSLCEQVCIRLRRDDVCITTLAVSIRDHKFITHSHQTKLPSPTNITSELYTHACALFDKSWDGTPIRQLGVHTSGVAEEEFRQMSLFDTQDYSRQAKADKTMDALRDKFGRDAIVRGSLLKNDPKRSDAPDR